MSLTVVVLVLVINATLKTVKIMSKHDMYIQLEIILEIF